MHPVFRIGDDSERNELYSEIGENLFFVIECDTKPFREIGCQERRDFVGLFLGDDNNFEFMLDSFGYFLHVVYRGETASIGGVEKDEQRIVGCSGGLIGEPEDIFEFGRFFPDDDVLGQDRPRKRTSQEG